MAKLGVFRDRRAALSAGATVALLVALEAADAVSAGSSDDDVRDRATIELFGGAMAAAIGASLVSLVRRRPIPRRPVWWSTGLGVIWVGAAINRVARHQLGRHYRSKLTVVPEHEVVNRGLYRLIRHPMYAGTSLICAGAAMALAAPASGVWVLPVVALMYRMEVEERMLRDTLGADYDDFVEGRPRLIPRLG